MSNDNLDRLLSDYADDSEKLKGEGDLGLITTLANEQIDLENRLEVAEANVKAIKEELRQVTEERLPEAMLACGIRDFTLEDGSKVTVHDDIATSVVADKRAQAFDWLERNGHGSIVKHMVSLSFGKGEGTNAHRAAEILREAGFAPTDKEDVHYQTLQAWGRRMAEEGIRPPEEFFHSFDVRKTKIKAPKK